MRKEILLRELTKLNILYNPKKSAEELQVIAGMWLEDLGHISDQMFLKCIPLVRRRSKWFPMPSEVLEAYREIMNNPHYNALADKSRKLIEHNEKIDRPTAEQMQKASSSLVAKLQSRFSMPRKPVPPRKTVAQYRPKTAAEKREHRDRVLRQAREIQNAVN